MKIYYRFIINDSGKIELFKYLKNVETERSLLLNKFSGDLSLGNLTIEEDIFYVDKTQRGKMVFETKDEAITDLLIRNERKIKEKNTKINNIKKNLKQAIYSLKKDEATLDEIRRIKANSL